MRRPSWNKSQAIQQVISLKALLESNDDSGAGALRKILDSPPPPPAPPQNAAAHVASDSGDSVKEVAFGEEGSPYRRKDLPLKAATTAEIGCRGGDTDNKNLSPRSPCETNELGGQMTIFYCGKVNVYEGVPLDKARAIMHLAATPIDFPQDNLCSANAALRSILCHVQAAGDKNGLIAPTTLNSHTMQPEKMAEYQQQFREKGNITRDSDVDGQVNRKVSLQRYLEKRKDRGRLFKGRKNTGQTSSGLEMYLNHQIRNHNSNGQSSRSSTGSPPQSGLPNAFCSSADNQGKPANLSVDLNDESVQEH
ncbi:Tify [Corchorus olitorius]|uniref:Protein TIFY n=1 Tax=Corchorus olitorius TaxID=93759 RepID=A0A1R3ISM6_9ROSI|nr:Tify [Corchorus olitorius]